MPTSTWFGGAVGVPRPGADEAEDDQDAGEAGDGEQQRGDERDAADEQQQLDRVGPVGLHRITVRRRSSSSEARAARRLVGARRGGRSARRPRSPSTTRPSARASSSV